MSQLCSPRLSSTIFVLDIEAYSAKERGAGVHAAPTRVPQHQAADEEGEGGGGQGDRLEEQLRHSPHFPRSCQAL